MRRFLLAVLVVSAGCGTAPPAPPPSFFALGGDVYHAEDRLEAEQQLLQFDPEPRWFAGYPRQVTREAYEVWEKQQRGVSRQEPSEGEPQYQIPTRPAYPRSVEALPRRDQGATLKLTAENDGLPAAEEVVLTLELAAGDRAIQREVEHRRTNVLPFLFCFTADGKPVSRECPGGVSDGGTKKFVELAPAKSQKTWTLRIATESLASLLPAGTGEATLVAVFSERQHEYYEEGGPMSGGEVWSSIALKTRPPQIVLRSNAVRLRKEGAKWSARIEE